MNKPRIPEWWPEDPENYDVPYVEVYKEVENHQAPFHIGQPYSGKVCPRIVCNCGNDQFAVGHGDYFTAFRCDKCGWERCIHSG